MRAEKLKPRAKGKEGGGSQSKKDGPVYDACPLGLRDFGGGWLLQPRPLAAAAGLVGRKGCFCSSLFIIRTPLPAHSLWLKAGQLAVGRPAAEAGA
ncbi:hypothetical protein HPB50_019859 [Hyalomma asiaticum]|uniref:Uncharacterized protein n=1 Tax=Hyalomma asiaticum TaxID=266040 RepID=A0ACB7RLY7_HYAAI|nr:hypothetical protein HPB50_019859 [Hyalomma asiaticum]